MIFCYPWWRLLTPRSRTLACGCGSRVSETIRERNFDYRSCILTSRQEQDLKNFSYISICTAGEISEDLQALDALARLANRFQGAYEWPHKPLWQPRCLQFMWCCFGSVCFLTTPLFCAHLVGNSPLPLVLRSGTTRGSGEHSTDFKNL